MTLILTGLSLLLAGCAASQARPIQPGLRNFRAASAGCQIQSLRGNPQDALAQVLRSAPACPTDVFGFRQLLQQRGARIQTTMVANRGFHNAAEGSFSLFETITGPIQQVDFSLAPGNLFFGHFTGAEGGKLVNLQSPEPGNLMIELIAWDPGKKLYNFYELIGNGQRGDWFYRGDSQDIRADITDLHRQANPAQPHFGRRLRCSGCHLSGGPIMKELALPHNDWWSAQRRLPLGGHQPDARLVGMMNGLEDAELLASHVRSGIAQLQASTPFNAAEDLQARLRPLFCPQEINFESDAQPLDQAGPELNLPAGLLVDPRLAAGPLRNASASYVAALRTSGSRFPEIDRADGDHAWLGPVKAWSDQQEIASLVRQGLIDAEFVSDVLAIDFTRPVVSPQRCGLLPLLPRTAAPGWQQQFRTNLAASQLPAARQLAAHLAQNDLPAHQEQARRFLGACQQRLQTPDGVSELLTWVGTQRQAVAHSEISANPLGQILEPGFRVIFPVLQLPATQPRLDENCKLVNR